MADNIDVDKLKKDALMAIDDLFSEEEDESSESQDPAEDIAQLEEDILTLDWEFSEKQLNTFWGNLNSVADKYTDKYSQAMINLLKKLVNYLYKSKDKAFPGTLNTMGYVVKSLKKINTQQMETSEAKAEFDATYQKVYSLKQKIEEYNAELVAKSKKKAQNRKSESEETDQESETDVDKEDQSIQATDSESGAEEVLQREQQQEVAGSLQEEQPGKEEEQSEEVELVEEAEEAEDADLGKQEEPIQTSDTETGAEEVIQTEQEPEVASSWQEEQSEQEVETEADLQESQAKEGFSDTSIDMPENLEARSASDSTASTASSLDQADVYEKLEQFEQRIRYLEDQNRKLYNIILSRERSSDFSTPDAAFEGEGESEPQVADEIASQVVESEMPQGSSSNHIESLNEQIASETTAGDENLFAVQTEDSNLGSEDESVSDELSEVIQDEKYTSREEESTSDWEQEPEEFDSIGEYAEIVRFFVINGQPIAFPNEYINNTYKLPGKLKKNINKYDSLSLGKLASFSQKLSKEMEGDLADFSEKDLKNLTADIYFLSEVNTKYEYVVLCSCQERYVIVPVSDQDKSKSTEIVEYLDLENDYSPYSLTEDMANIPLIFPC